MRAWENSKNELKSDVNSRLKSDLIIDIDFSEFQREKLETGFTIYSRHRQRTSIRSSQNVIETIVFVVVFDFVEKNFLSWLYYIASIINLL